MNAALEARDEIVRSCVSSEGGAPPTPQPIKRAAAQLTLEELADGLDQRFELLSRSVEGRSPFHRTRRHGRPYLV